METTLSFSLISYIRMSEDEVIPPVRHLTSDGLIVSIMSKEEALSSNLDLIMPSHREGRPH